MQNNKKYLNSEFLNTAAFYATSNMEVKINYIDYVYPKTDEQPCDLGVKIKQKTILCEKITFTKTENTAILVNHLIANLFNKYKELALENDMSIRHKFTTKNNFLVRWIKGDADFLIDENNINNIIHKILLAANNIAVNSRLGIASFIVVSPKMLSIIQNTPNFTYNMFGKIKVENEIISKVGIINNLNIFVNYDSNDNTILIGRSTSNDNCGVVLVEHNIEIDNKFIIWKGAIDSYSENSKYMYEIININSIKDFPWYKKLTYKLLKKINKI
jgi:hypothetical protein